MLKALLGFAFLALFSATTTVNSMPNNPIDPDHRGPKLVAMEKEQPPYPTNSPKFPKLRVGAVRKIFCDNMGWGTGSVVGKDTVITAYHVVEGRTSCIDVETGKPMTLKWADPDQDFAVMHFETDRDTPWLKISCDGFDPKKTYYAMGYAGVGRGDLMITRVLPTDKLTLLERDFRSGTLFKNMRITEGVVIQGMSGGPVINDKGQITGMNNATASNYQIGLLRDMKDTYFCSAKKRR